MYIVLRIALLALAFFFASCAGNVAETPLPQPERATEEWEGERSSILVLAGQDFPEESGIADFVAWEYGLALEKGRARVLYWPATFEALGASLDLLSGIARNEQPEIVVAVGAPPGALVELNRIRAAFPEIKIASIFPSGEALAVEAVSDMVIDMGISFVQEAGLGAAMVAEEETVLDIKTHEAAALVLGAVFSMEMLKMNGGSSLEPASVLLERGMRFAESAAMRAHEGFAPLFWEYSLAADPDTGLRSRRHILIHKAGRGI